MACWFVASRIPLRLVGYGVLTKRPRGVTVSTLDSESSDRGSNPREVFHLVHGHRPVGIGACVCVFVRTRTCGLVAMTSASHAEGPQFDPGQVYLGAIAVVTYTSPGSNW